jgi:serine/threonine protein kinase
LYGVAIKDDLTQIYLVLESLEKSLHNLLNNELLQSSTSSDEDDDYDDEDSSRSSSISSISSDNSHHSESSESSNTNQTGNLNHNIPSEQLKILFFQLIKAFYYIHGIGIIHNDIKLLNLMINNNDIRIIDFGLSEFLGVGPCQDLISDYICTEITKAPDSEDQKKFGYLQKNRKSYASDMFSIGCSMVQLATNSNTKIMVTKNNNICSVDSRGGIIQDLTSLIISEEKFGREGYDLLLQIMNPDTHLRWCTVNALHHSYFMGLSENILIDRTIIQGGNINSIYDRQVQYSFEEYKYNQMEICYLEIQHQTFIDNVIPLKRLLQRGISVYYVLIDWLLDVYLKTNLIEGFDTFINNLCIINNFWNDIYTKYGSSKEIQMLGILPNHISRSIFNYTNKDIEYYCEISGGAFNRSAAFNFLLNDLLINNNFNMPIYPFSIHIQYVYLQLKYVLDESKIKSEEVIKDIFINICLHIIFWLIQPEPFQHSVSIWEIVIFSTNRTLSLILNIPLYELNINPLLHFLTIEDNKYSEMNIYFQSRFRNTIIINRLSEYKNLASIFYINALNPIDKSHLFKK